MHFVRRFKSLPLASACFLSALLTLPALAEWQVNSATSPTILSNAETGWTLTVKKETGGLILQSTTAGEGRLDLERVVASESLESVGKLAFYNCSQLQSFNPWCLPRLETLGSQAFCGCTELAGDFSFPRLAAIPYMDFQGTKVSSVLRTGDDGTMIRLL